MSEYLGPERTEAFEPSTGEDLPPLSTESLDDLPPPESGDGMLRFLKDNLEAIAVAVVMALIIKHFCVEAFKIPTSSMFPTLKGESDNPDGEGDRILVDKFAYLIEDPARWQVIVFKYPLNQARNFIKRIAGLPGEHFAISDDGDLWVRPGGKGGGEDDLRIPQKPRDVREQFYRSVYPPPPPKKSDPRRSVRRTPFSAGQYFSADEGAAGGWRLEDLHRFVFAGGPAASLRNVPSILAHTTPESWATSSGAGELVRDVRFRMTLRIDDAQGGAEAPPTRFTLRWQPDAEFLTALTLTSGGKRSEAFIRRGRETIAQAQVPVRLSPGRAYAVEMEYVDGRLRIRIDDEELAVLRDGRRFSDTKESAGDQRFRMEAEGGGLTVEDLAIDRDLRYGNSWDSNPEARRGGLDIPAHSYFMLGDNTSNSSDSRRWRMVYVHLKGGRTIRYDYGDPPDYLDASADGRTLKRVTDADGIVRTWAEEDQDDERGSETLAAPFVDRSLIVGRAFLVFWPWVPTFPGRLGFIK